MKYFSSSSSFDLFIYTPFCFCLLKSLFSIIFWNDWTSLIIPKVTIKTSQWAINQTIEHSTNCPQRVNSRCGCKNFTDECFWWVKEISILSMLQVKHGRVFEQRFNIATQVFMNLYPAHPSHTAQIKNRNWSTAGKQAIWNKYGWREEWKEPGWHLLHTQVSL